MAWDKLRDIPCGDCGWKFKGFHICLDLSDPAVREVVPGPGRKPRVSRAVAGSDRAASIRAFHANDPRKVERNREIIRLYNELDMTMREVAEKMAIDPTTVRNILHRAADEGDVIIRKAARRTGRY